MFGSDAALWYNVGDWAPLGLAVPNWSDDTESKNGNIRYLLNVMGRNLQAVMFHDDARLRTPPSINTLTRVHKLCTRARDIMASRAVPENELDMESAHAEPAPEVHLVYPTPYFKVRNQWLKDYCGLILTACTEALQHQENAKSIEISTRFSGLVGQYIRRVYRLMAVELFKVPIADAKKPDFTLTDEQLAAYNPSSWFTSTELIDTVPQAVDQPTEDDLRVLTDGIPVTMLPNLPRWPATVGTGGPEPAGENPSGAAFAPAPGA